MLPEALPYHLKVRDHLQGQASTWEFFSAARTREEQEGSLQPELLKDCRPLTREKDAELYAQIDLARERLGLAAIGVTACEEEAANAAARIIFLRRQAFLVLAGPVLESTAAERLAVIARALSLVRLYTLEDGTLEIADRIVTAMAHHPASDASCRETARLFQLHTALFCDRGVLAVTGDGVDGSGEQGEQGVARPGEGTADLNRLDMNRLDLFGQAALYALTRGILWELLQPEEFRTDLTLRMAHQYFPDLSWPGAGTGAVRERLVATLSGAAVNVHDYFSYLLQDIAQADPSLAVRLGERVRAFAEETQLSVK